MYASFFVYCPMTGVHVLTFRGFFQGRPEYIRAFLMSHVEYSQRLRISSTDRCMSLSDLQSGMAVNFMEGQDEYYFVAMVASLVYDYKKNTRNNLSSRYLVLLSVMQIVKIFI